MCVCAHWFYHVTLANYDLSRALAPSPVQGSRSLSLAFLVDPHGSGMVPVAMGTQKLAAIVAEGLSLQQQLLCSLVAPVGRLAMFPQSVPEGSWVTRQSDRRETHRGFCPHQNCRRGRKRAGAGETAGRDTAETHLL